METCGKGRIPGPAYALGNLTGYENHDFTKSRAPAYSLGLRSTQKALYPTPGPYNVGNVGRNGRYTNIGCFIGSKGPTQGKSVGPSPLSYAPEKMKYYTPAYSLGLKLPSLSRPFGPSPADYFPQYPTQPGFTIGNPWKKVNKQAPPGPQAAVPTDFYKPKAPAYSLGLKGRPIFQYNPGPGPKYYPGRICHHVPHAYSFGLKHSKCSPPLITHEDNN